MSAKKQMLLLKCWLGYLKFRSTMLGTTAALILSSALPAFAQDATAGKRIFSQCGMCHQVGPTARSVTAPALNGLFGREAGSVSNYRYSEAMKASGLVWDEDTFREYIKDPQAMVPGSTMFFRLEDEKRIADLLAYLKQF